MKKNLFKILFRFILVLTLFNTSCKKQSISIDSLSYTIKIGETLELNPKATNIKDVEFNYTTIDNEIISLENNKITGLSAGAATVTISAVNSKTESINVEIKVEELPKPIKIVSEKNLTLVIDSTYQLSYQVEPFNASQEVLFSSSDKSVLTVDNNGLVTCVDLGDAFITIKSKENNNVKLRIEVEVVLPEIEKINCINELSLGYDETYQLEYSISPSNAVQDVSFKSLNEEIVTVNESGLISAKKPGVTKVVITSTFDSSKYLEIEVKVAGTKAVTIQTTEELNLSLGQLHKIDYEVFPSDAYQGLNFISSDESALEVDEYGVIVAKKSGTYTLSLSTIDGTNISKKINVNINAQADLVFSFSEDFEQDTTISLNEDFDPYYGVRVFDSIEGELTNKLVVNNNVNTSEYGKYKVSYKVKDKDSNEISFDREIEVVWDYSVTFIGHAGSLYGAMNSEEAILYAAKELKYTAIEIDLKQTKDGVFVLSHDETFAGYELSQYNWSELKDVEVTVTRSPGISDPAPKDSYTAKLCTLKRYLEICKEYNITAVIELKTSAGISNWTEQNRPDTSRMPALIEEIEKVGMINNIIFLTSQYECLAWTRRNGYDFIPCQYLVSTCENQTYLDTCIKYNLDISFNVRDGVKNSTTWIKKYKDAGLQVSTYTFEQWASYSEIQEWIDKGVDFVTTDWHDVSKLNLPKDE